jgi:hypothetical protein
MFAAEVLAFSEPRLTAPVYMSAGD